MSKLTLGYCGTPQISAQFLSLIKDNKNLDIKFVLTQPDRPAGRQLSLTPTPVKKTAINLGLDYYTSLQEIINAASYVDIMLTFAYGKIIPSRFLNLPRLGWWNIHPSLLPKYRGASPIAYPLILGEVTTGATLFQMDEQLDHGPIISQKSVAIGNQEKREDLEKKLVTVAFEIFDDTIEQICAHDNENYTINYRLQNETMATYTRPLQKADGFIPFYIIKKAINGEKKTSWLPAIIKEYQRQNASIDLPNVLAQIICQLYRGLSPWPGLWTEIIINKQKKRLKLLDVKMEDQRLILRQVQLEGKKPVDFSTFCRAYAIDLSIK